MNYCVNCGHELGVGRYCTNCGHPIDVPVDTAERPRVPPAPEPPAPAAQPPAWSPPPPVRYPLYAEEAPLGGEPPGPPTRHKASRLWGIWAAVALALLLVMVLGVALLFGGDDGGDDSTATSPGADATSSPKPEKSPSEKASATPEVPAGSVTADAAVTVPAIAAPGRDVNGRPVTYAAENMLDGVPETTWRMPGDGTGSELAITLAESTRLRSVGLINGYAKQEGGHDWYHGNRRVEQVEWVFDDGTTVSQDLDETTGVQSVDVDVTTTTITLRLVAVSAPGTGPDSRDFTAISDLLLVAGT
jgi:hypothetical protein